MTRRDYTLLAGVLAGSVERARATSYLGQVERIAFDMADALGAENPRFDRDRFLVACGVEDHAAL